MMNSHPAASIHEVTITSSHITISYLTQLGHNGDAIHGNTRGCNWSTGDQWGCTRGGGGDKMGGHINTGAQQQTTPTDEDRLLPTSRLSISTE
jgi:hypothetical protein